MTSPMEITNDRRRELEADTLESTTEYRSPPASSPRSAPRSEAELARTYDSLPPSSDYGAYLVQLGNARGVASVAQRGPSEAEIQQRLDEFRDRFSGPYAVEGQSLSVPPMFRMNMPGAYNAALQKQSWRELGAICAKGNVPSYAWMCVSGRCTPEQLVRVTQLLLDAGKLPPPDAEHPTVESRVRLMQWSFGIGVDCAGYTQRAAAFAHGEVGGRAFRGDVMGDLFSNMGKDARFVKVAHEDIRAGDVIHLNNPDGGVGHNVIVRDHTLLDAQTKAHLRAAHPHTAGAYLDGAGPFHMFQVDSSWGANDGRHYGGFRRDTWIYDAASKTWASFTTPHTPQEPRILMPDPIGPQNEIFAGAYRPRL